MRMRMLRTALAGVLLLGVVSLTRADSVCLIDPAKKAEDKDRESEQRNITIEDEGPGGIKIKMKMGKNDVIKQVPVKDIVFVVYETPSVSRLTFRAPFSKENSARSASKARRAKLLEEAMDGYSRLAEAMKDRPTARRYLQFKMAEVTMLQAEDDPTKTDTAIRMLTDFKKDGASTWTITPALKMLARLQEDAGRTDEARKTYEELAELPELPQELKQESEILVGRLLLRGEVRRRGETSGQTGQPDEHRRHATAVGAGVPRGEPDRPEQAGHGGKGPARSDPRQHRQPNASRGLQPAGRLLFT